MTENPQRGVMTGPLFWLALLATAWWWAEHGKGVTPKTDSPRHKRSDSGYAPGGRTSSIAERDGRPDLP